MARLKAVTVNGTNYASLKEAARHLGFNRKTVEKWVATRAPGETVSTTIERHVNAKKVQVGDDEYKNAAEAGRSIGVAGSEVARIVRRQVDVAQAMQQRNLRNIDRTSAARRRQIDWEKLPFAEVFATWEVSRNILSNLDVSRAIRTPGANGKPALVGGIRCAKHDLTLGLMQIGVLKAGRQPCPLCSAENRQGMPATIRRRTVERLQEAVRRHGMPLDLSTVELVTGKQLGRTGDLFVVGAVCTRCNGTIPDAHYCHMEKGSHRCPNCHDGHYSEAEVVRMVHDAHQGFVEMISFGGGLKAKSRFRCIECGCDWPALANAVIGSTANRPTGCPDCSRPGLRAGVVALALDKLGAVYEREWSFEAPGWQGRLLRSDYYLPEYRLCIEFDGDHHYVPSSRHRNPVVARRMYLEVVERDLVKRDTLLARGIKTCRIPIWAPDVHAEVKQILSGHPTYPDLPDPGHFPNSRRHRRNDG